ncbi:MAG: hypothetical protein ABJA66_02750 [Actinomycetota bacterium]
MKISILLTLLLVSVFVLSAEAQEDFYSTRLDNFANQLKRSSVDLVDRTSSDLRRGSSNTRAVIEEAFLAHQFDASAGLFQQMISDKRPATELRDGAAILTDLARRAPSSGSNSNLWRNVQTSITDINRELGGTTGGGGGNTDNRPVIGRVYWRGTVDDKIQLVIHGSQIETRTIAGRTYPDGTFSFTAALPTRNVAVEVSKTKGRGSAQVIQQPSKSNDFTTIIEISDSDGGAKEYLLDIYWR